ncbi:plasminogen activator inhibitor 1 RNA-binding protein [Diaphorina citri]|uniref:Plasminogen activator inhibitor 1 RNA-binding protein n=1 Tax=Diaphorina citri TaxID=121845 RepID=A0A1S3D683_DIACI|nr:plasminogen activator inhibitor 1 RNA-binding protein [Diaphorina citri]
MHRLALALAQSSGQGGGGGGGRGDYRGGKREFDRQSGSDRTGIKATTKRNGAGPHNWGTDRDEIDEQVSGGNPANDISGDWGDQNAKLSDSVTNNESNPEKAESVPGADQPTTEADEAAKEITLDEWKASRGTKLLKPQYNLRKAGEGEDLSQWEGMYELKKKKEEAAAAQLIEEEKAAESAAKAPKKKEIVDTNFHFADQPTRGGRGKGRGGMRGGRGGGGERGERGERSFRGGDRRTCFGTKN